ncbi:alpha/beta fold hydrolase [Minwuia sp.]|uniref:alpha/beta fold hydrolase n=1 Tax=Minwuia sp. TaxID=2493630 RepID=UPI003A8E942D
MPTLKIRDLDQVYYDQKGEGPDVLVITGTGSDLRRPPTPLDSPLTKHFRVTTYDQRGLGQTSKPDDGYTMEAYADDAAAIMDALELAPCPVLGISFGGMVLQNLMARHPGKVSRAALWCTSPGGAGGASYPLDTLSPDLTQEEKFRTMIKLSDNRVTDDWFEKDVEKVEVLRKRADKTEFYGEHNYQHGMAMQIQARKHHDCWEALAGIDTPALCGGGTNDDIATPEAMRNLAERMPNAELRLYDGGHMFFIQVPEAYDDLIAFFKAS